MMYDGATMSPFRSATAQAHDVQVFVKHIPPTRGGEKDPHKVSWGGSQEELTERHAESSLDVGNGKPAAMVGQNAFSTTNGEASAVVTNSPRRRRRRALAIGSTRAFASLTGRRGELCGAAARRLA